MKVRLEVVIDAIEMTDDNFTYYLDLETWGSVFLADELITGLDNGGLADEIEENSIREKLKMYETLKSVLKTPALHKDSNSILG